MLHQSTQIVEITVSIHISLIVLHSPLFTSYLASVWLFNCPQHYETIQWDPLHVDVNVCLL